MQDSALRKKVRWEDPCSPGLPDVYRDQAGLTGPRNLIKAWLIVNACCGLIKGFVSTQKSGLNREMCEIICLCISISIYLHLYLYLPTYLYTHMYIDVCIYLRFFWGETRRRKDGSSELSLEKLQLIEI